LKSEMIWKRKIQKKIVKRYEKYGRNPSWNVKWYGKYGRKVSWIVKWYGKQGRKAGRIAVRYGTNWRKLWNDMENMEERQV
jgi:hypothetical protein